MLIVVVWFLSEIKKVKGYLFPNYILKNNIIIITYYI